MSTCRERVTLNLALREILLFQLFLESNKRWSKSQNGIHFCCLGWGHAGSIQSVKYPLTIYFFSINPCLSCQILNWTISSSLLRHESAWWTNICLQPHQEHSRLFLVSQLATRDLPRPINDFSVVPGDLQLIEPRFSQVVNVAWFVPFSLVV